MSRVRMFIKLSQGQHMVVLESCILYVNTHRQRERERDTHTHTQRGINMHRYLESRVVICCILGSALEVIKQPVVPGGRLGSPAALRASPGSGVAVGFSWESWCVGPEDLW